jgi:hypothetical protein
VSVLDEWTQPFKGLCLYYPGHRHIPMGLKAFIAFIRNRVTLLQSGALQTVGRILRTVPSATEFAGGSTH